MPGFTTDVATKMMCPHGAQVTTTPGNPRVKVLGQPIATMADTSMIAGCPFTLPGGKPSPCTTVEWLVPAARIKAGGQAVLLQTSTGLCMSPENAPQGPPTLIAGQTRVKGI